MNLYDEMDRAVLDWATSRHPTPPRVLIDGIIDQHIRPREAQITRLQGVIRELVDTYAWDIEDVRDLVGPDREWTGLEPGDLDPPALNTIAQEYTP